MTDIPAHIRPLGIQSLPDGHVPCWACGLPVPGTGDQAATSLVRVLADGRSEDAAAEFMFGRCERCVALVAQAADIVDTFPSLGRFGSLNILRERFARVLFALAAIGQNPPAAWSDYAVVTGLNRLEVLGRAFTWAARFAPVRQADSRADECASEAWLYAPAEVRQRARREYGEWLIDQLPPRPQSSPDTPCALCGVGTFPARRVLEAWHFERGRRYCAACAPFAVEHNTLASQVDAAVVAHIDPDWHIRRKRPYAPRFKNVKPFCDTGRTEPNAEPFAHVHGLDGLRRKLETGDW